MNENLLIYTFMLIIIICVVFLLIIEYKIKLQKIKIKRNDELLDACNERIFNLLDNILLTLPGEVFIPHSGEEIQDFEVKELVEEYLDIVMDIYDTCGTYCRNSHFSEAQLKEHFGKYISFLKEDRTLNRLIESNPGYYEGVEYLIKVCS